MTKRNFIFWVSLLVLTAVGATIYEPTLVPVKLSGDNAENYRDTADRNTISTIFDPFFITTSKGANTYYCPMQSVAWLGLARIFGLNTVYYRLISLSIHLACTMLVVVLARDLLNSNLWGIVSGAFFLLFYRHIRIVSFVSAEITHGLCLIFYLAALVAFHRYLSSRRIASYFAAFIFFALAHLTKETAWSLLPVMMALEYLHFLPAEKKKITFDNVAEYANKYFPFAFVLCGAMLIFILKYPSGDIARSWGGASLSVNVPNRFFDLLNMLVVPIPISATMQLVGLNIFILGIFAGAVFGTPLLRWLLLWTALALLPFCVSNFRPAGELPRYLYLASVPLSVMLSYGAVGSKTKTAAVRALLTALPLLAVALHAFLTVRSLWR